MIQTIQGVWQVSHTSKYIYLAGSPQLWQVSPITIVISGRFPSTLTDSTLVDSTLADSTLTSSSPVEPARVKSSFLAV